MPVLPSGRYLTGSGRPRPGGHEGDRRPETGRRGHAGDPPPGLHGVARLAQAVAQDRCRLGEVVDEERDAPQPRGAVGVGGDLRALGRVDDLEDHVAHAKEGLAVRAAGRLPLAHPTKVEAGLAQDTGGAVEVGADHHHVVDRDRAVGVRGARGRRLARGPRVEPVELEGAGVAHRPACDPAPVAVALEAQPHAADLDRAVTHLEAGGLPGVRGGGDEQLVEGRGAHGRATRLAVGFALIGAVVLRLPVALVLVLAARPVVVDLGRLRLVVDLVPLARVAVLVRLVLLVLGGRRDARVVAVIVAAGLVLSFAAVVLGLRLAALVAAPVMGLAARAAVALAALARARFPQLAVLRRRGRLLCGG